LETRKKKNARPSVKKFTGTTQVCAPEMPDGPWKNSQRGWKELASLPGRTGVFGRRGGSLDRSRESKRGDVLGDVESVLQGVLKSGKRKSRCTQGLVEKNEFTIGPRWEAGGAETKTARQNILKRAVPL